MSAAVDLPDVSTLGGDAVGVMPVDRDWSRGYPETWDYIEAPSCLECGSYAVWAEPADVLDAATTDAQRTAILAETDARAWRCSDPTCERYGIEIERGEGGDEGPMMNYSYALPSRGRVYDERDAEKIGHLPLCIVFATGPDALDAPFALALTGGGEDLSWQICEAFALLGFAPPLHFCDLPGMAGKPDGPRDAFVIAACRRTVEIVTARADRIDRGLRDMAGETGTLTDREALKAIHAALDGPDDWSPDELDIIADVLRASGRPIVDGEG